MFTPASNHNFQASSIERFRDDFDFTGSEEIRVEPKQMAKGDIDVGLYCGLSAAVTDQIRKCRNAIILSLIKAMYLGCDGIYYSRNRNTYLRENSTHPKYWTYNNVRAAVRTFEQSSGYFRHHQQQPARPRKGERRRSSSIYPGPLLFGIDTTDLLLTPALAPADRIEVRDTDKRPMPYKHSAETRLTEEFLRRYDRAVGALTITFHGPGCTVNQDGLYVVKGRTRPYCINTNLRSLVRIFNGTQARGGRWYRAFWQNLPGHLRTCLKINGSPVFEHDYSACHPRLVYAAVGQEWPFNEHGRGDAYRLPGRNDDRHLVKCATSILLNTRSLNEAIGAVARELPGLDYSANRLLAAELILAIKAHHHPDVVEFFHSKRGNALQFVDSKIIMICLDKLLDREIVGLPVHDSIIVAAEHKDTLIHIMEQTFANEGRKLALKRFAKMHARTGFRRQDLTMGEDRRVGVVNSHDELANASTPVAGRRRFLTWIMGALKPLDPALHDQIADQPRCAQAFPIDVALTDLRKIICSRKRLSKGCVRTLLVFHGMQTKCLETTIGRSQAWLAESASTDVCQNKDLIDAEIARFRRCRLSAIELAAAAKLCGVSRKNADALGLLVLRPEQKLPVTATERAERSQAKSWNDGAVPPIVHIGKATPWLGHRLKRSQWYSAYPGKIERQLLALRMHIERRDQEALTKIEGKIANFRRVRDAFCRVGHLPVDDLLDKLSQALASSTRGAFFDPP